MTDEAAIILMVEAEIDRAQARNRAKRVIDAARAELRKQKCRRQGIPTSSAQCQAIIARADEAMMRTTESARPIRPFAPEAQSKLLAEAAADPEQRVAMVHTRTDDDGQEWAWITWGSWEEARRHYQTTEAADG